MDRHPAFRIGEGVWVGDSGEWCNRRMASNDLPLDEDTQPPLEI
jgi:hypothetical protein